MKNYKKELIKMMESIENPKLSAYLYKLIKTFLELRS